MAHAHDSLDVEKEALLDHKAGVGTTLPRTPPPTIKRAHKYVKLGVVFVATGLYLLLFCAHTPQTPRHEYAAYFQTVLAAGVDVAPAQRPLLDWMFPFLRYFHHGRHRHHHHHHHHGPMLPAEAERLFLTLPKNDSIHATSQSFTNQSHVAGTIGDWNTAVLIKKQLEKSFGIPETHIHHNVFDAGTKDSKRMLYGPHCRHKRGHYKGENPSGIRIWTDKYYPLLNLPRGNSSISLLAKNGTSIFNATLREDAMPEDPTAVNGSATSFPFHGYSFPGSARGELVYANMGTQKDYEALEAAGISLKGKIVLVRYGKVFRGLKVSGAEKYGAAGVIIYSDTSEDGPNTEANGFKVYPHGPARQPSSIQRGSVQKLSQYPGDPLTPGMPAYKDAQRLPRNSSDINIPRIPSLPLSLRDAEKLLKSLTGHGKKFGNAWDGALPGVEYWTGPGLNVSMVNDVVENVTAIWNTYAMIPGHVQSETVMLGNHRDAWVFGAGDPNSGTAVVVELVKAFSILLEKGWKPLRNILIASWDAEEYGLVGSTEFVEDHEKWILDNVVAYVNVDIAAVGSSYSARATPSLSHLLASLLTLVPHPDQPDKSILKTIANDINITEIEAVTNANLWMFNLGSGSDFTPFLQHTGIASSNTAFIPYGDDPVYHYHSIYDSAHWMEKFGDPGFHRHVAEAKVLGLQVLRLADDVILPINVSAYASTLSIKYIDDVKSIPGAEQIDFNQFDKATSKLSRATSCLARNVEFLKSQISCLRDSKVDCDDTMSIRKMVKKIVQMNKKLREFESQFIDKDGLPTRTWYRNLIVAPGRLKGYGATVLPGINEALNIDHDISGAQDQTNKLAKRIQHASKSIYSCHHHLTDCKV